ncbi:sulfurtransferase [Chitinimonas lacunae]|uniref:Sulfurtransferase n=1 Tax=Chitinimonas lacunae TaxID=1963018 RepID=A0ABV8MVF3_9NEIS
MNPLITAADLAAHQGEIVVVDCRHELADPEAGRLAYAAGHLPGAFFLHLDQDLSGPKTGRNGRHPLPEPAVLAQRFGAIGITAGRRVVGYDASGGIFAARLWWLLRWLGHDQVQVLDGGWQAWLEAGLPTNTELPDPRPGSFTAHPQRDWIVSAEELLAGLDQERHLVVDARSPTRFAGQDETLDPVGGHIPGARNRFFQHNLEPGGRFKSAAQLRQEWLALFAGWPVERTVQQCGSGVTACHNLLALEIAGLSGARLYPGSWSEWCSDPARPVATGAA